MNRIAKFQLNFCCSFSGVCRYSLTALLGVVLLSDAVGAKVGGLQNYSPKRSPEILLNKYQNKFPFLETGDKQVLLRSYQNQQEVYLAQQAASTPSIPLSPEQQKLYQQGVKLVEEAQELKKKGNREAYEQAIKKCQQALRIIQELGLRKEEVNILAYIANVYYSIDDTKNARDYLKQALYISRELKQPVWEATALASIGVIYINGNEPKEGLKYLQEAQSIFLAHKEYSSLATTLNGIATIHMRIGDTTKALDYQNEALKLYRERLNDLAGEADTLRDIATTYSLSSEPQTAIGYYEQALKIQHQRKDFPAEVKIITDIAALQDKLGNTKNAVESLKQALKLQQQAGFNLSDQANTIANIGHIYAGQADYLTAIDYYQQARKLFQQAGNTQMLSRTFQMIANVHKTFSGDYQKALELLDKALLLQIDDKDDQAFTLGQKADIYLSQANYQQALDEYNKALELQRSIPNPRSEARTLRNIALVYRYLGDYKSSLETYNKSLDIYKRTPNKSEEIATLASIATVYEWQDKYEEALEFYKQALSLLSKDDYQPEILIRHGMARTHNLLKNYTKALEFANRALELSQQNSFREEVSLNILASVYSAKGEYQKSLDISKKLLAYSRKVGLRIREALILSDMSITYQRQKNYNQAINTLNEELELRRELKDRTGEAQTLYLIAINQRNLGKLEAALSNIQTTIKIVESIRGNVQSDELRTSYFATVQNYYKFYIDLLMQLHKKDPLKAYNAQALHVSERSRARSLVELLTEANAKIRKDVDPKLLAEESSLLQKIDVTAKLLQQLPINSETQAIALKKESDNLLNQYKELQTKIRTTSPKYAALKYPEPLTLPQIQQQLDQDTLLLQYSLGKERSYLWAVTPNSLNTYELSGSEAIEKSARTFQELLRKCQNPVANCQNLPAAQKAKDLQEVTQAATQLSKLILAPVAKKLGKKRLVIVADGALQEIPFAALSEPNQKSNYQPLLVNHEIVNLPSVTAIAIHRRDLNKRPPAPKTLAVLADPVFEADDVRLTGKPPSLAPELIGVEQSSLNQAARNLKRTGWKRLLGTLTEAEQILKLVSPDQSLQALGFDANYNWATNQQLKQYRYLLFATHGFADPINPELSGIILSQLDKQGKPQTPGILRLGDIFNLDWNAELVVLSACETGVGKDVQGEGLMGLTRGLMYAGAKTAVVSLWQVNDKATSQLMPQFYTAMLQQKVSPTVALRESQLKLWRQGTWRNPYYWAAFTLQGEWR